MSITITFSPTRADLIALGYLGLQSRPMVLWSSIAFFVIFPWGAAAVFSTARLLGGPVGLISIFILIAVPPITALLFVLLLVRQVKGARTFQGTHVYSFAESGIQLKGPGFNNRLEWSALTNCFAGKLGLLFCSGQAPLISIPARGLPANVKLELLSLVSAHGITVKSAYVR